jgi:hypothetical protein
MAPTTLARWDVPVVVAAWVIVVLCGVLVTGLA